MLTLPFIIASNIVVACLLACLALLVGRAGRNATVAHVIWVAVFVKLITPPILPAPIPIPVASGNPLANFAHGSPIDTAVRPSNESQKTAADRVFPNNEMVIQHVSGWRFPSISLIDAFLVIAFVGAVTIVVRGLVRFVRFSSVLKREGCLDPTATRIVESLVNHPGFNRSCFWSVMPPTVRLVPARISPMLFGIGSGTCIVCPERLWQSLNEPQRLAFLAHEVAHFLRRDHWIRWVEWVASAVYWWFPPIAFARWQLERHEEAACDDWAISRLGISRRSYAETLLHVVDFLSHTKVCLPRLASPMQPTDCLEERLRLIMSSVPRHGSPRANAMWPAVLGLLMLVVHPFPTFVARATSRSEPGLVQPLIVANAVEANAPLRLEVSNKSPDESGHVDDSQLPPIPRGWWNDFPTQAWADHDFDGGMRLIARAGLGLELRLGSSTAHLFDADSIRAVARVPTSGRLVIGNASGELHLWDPKSMQSVSLIGSHSAAVSTIAYHPVACLVSGDCQGNLIAWDLQSGQMLGAATVDIPVCSARWSNQGDELIVLAGDWSASNSQSKLIRYLGHSLSDAQSQPLPNRIAALEHDTRLGWLAIDWSGIVLSLSSGDALWSINKAEVSGVVLCQDLFKRIPRRPLLNGRANR